MQLLASVLSGLLIDIVGRKPLLIISSTLMSLSIACLGSYVRYKSDTSTVNLEWIPLLCILIFTISYFLGKKIN